MRPILTRLTFWAFLVWSCLVLGSSLYEAVVVVPLVHSIHLGLWRQRIRCWLCRNARECSFGPR